MLNPVSLIPNLVGRILSSQYLTQPDRIVDSTWATEVAQDSIIIISFHITDYKLLNECSIAPHLPQARSLKNRLYEARHLNRKETPDPVPVSSNSRIVLQVHLSRSISIPRRADILECGGVRHADRDIRLALYELHR